MNSKVILIGIVAGIVVLAVGGWFFLRPSPQAQTANQTGSFGAGEERAAGGGFSADVSSTTEPPNSSTPAAAAAQKIFKISDGPVAGATFVQTYRPTTTLARFVMAENGHVADLVIDSAGAISKPVSNTTIPGVARVLWGEAGAAAMVEYLDDGVVKTAYIGFPPATATSTLSRAVRMQFLPDGIVDLAVSPDGKSVAYLLRTTAGSDGYIAKIDGSGVKKLFSVPFNEVLLSWPSPTTLLVQTKSAASLAGAAFSVNATSGAVVPLLQAPGLTVSADRSFSRILYQTVDGAQTSYFYDTRSSKNVPLSFDPIPEKCSWSTISTTTVFCAVPSQYIPANYLDLWHQGASSVSDAVYAYSSISGKSVLVTIPGSFQGGEAADIVGLTQSADGRYLLYIRKGDRSLWGVRL